MSRKVAPVPKGYRTVTPELVVRGADAAIAFYTEVFGADELSRVVGEDGVTVLQAELKIGNSIVRIVDEIPAFGILSPAGFGGTASAMHIYHADAADIWERALACDAGILVPFADTPWGERYGRFVDPYGHVWSVSRRIARPSENRSEDAPEAVMEGGFSVHEPRADKAGLTTEQEAVLRSGEEQRTNAA